MKMLFSKVKLGDCGANGIFLTMFFISPVVDPTSCFPDHPYTRGKAFDAAQDVVHLAIQTDLTMEAIAELEDKSKYMRVLFEDAVSCDDESVQFFTGLPSKSTLCGEWSDKCLHKLNLSILQSLSNPFGHGHSQ